MSTHGLDPRTPIIVGVGQLNDHGIEAEPVAMMVAAVDSAATDAGARQSLLAAADWVRVPWGIWPYADPGRLVADQVGAINARTTKTTVGGNQVYDLLIDSAVRIGHGEADVIVVCGAETQRSRTAAKRAGQRSTYLDERPGAAPDEVFGSDTPLATEAETAIGMNAPIVFYAMAESAIRHRNGESVPTHADRIAKLWSVGAAVAAENPRAWLRDGPSATEIGTPSNTNRPITAPYTKLLTSNLAVNQAGAYIVCSVEAAERLGIATDRWIFPHSGVSGADATFVTNRWAFDESPSMRIAGRRALVLADVDVDDCALLDLYSCFPAAVQVAQREMEVPSDRVWTVTGGLTFAAGPLNCYCLLPMVRSVELLREMPEQTAFLTGNGGYFTKHSFITLSGTPPVNGFRTESVQAEIDAEPTRPTPSINGPAQRDQLAASSVEAYTVVYDRDGQPERGVLAALGPDEARHLVATTDQTLIADLIANDWVEAGVPVDAVDAPVA